MTMRALTLTGEWAPRPGADLSSTELEARCANDARQAWRNPEWRVTDHPSPQCRDRDDVVVMVLRAGIARSNCKSIETDEDGYVRLPYRMRLPVVPGHEVAGIVVEIGPAVRDLRVGEFVTVQALRPCGLCRNCRTGHFNNCLDLSFAGLTTDGGMAEYLVAPARNLFSLERLVERVGEEAALDIGVVCEPAAVAYVGMFGQARGFKPGAMVAVFGCGPIGLSAIALARAAGAAGIVAVDRASGRLALAERLGADLILDSRDLQSDGVDAGEALGHFTHGRGIDFAVEATGDGASFFPEVEKALGRGARVLSLGVERAPMPIRILPYQEASATLTGSIGHIGGFEPVIALHTGGRLDLSQMIEGRYSLGAAYDALAVASRFEEAKIVIEPQRRD
ncbi:alcohol dehydrogenase catalytic domain-containing protein [Sphingomonas fuzhouensis]|uniref:alcohol dehydrogenase catalytic domain-containing protein n=1 Tax=Sphingomonas fuzhouensis TaxID=3106033 RepID=UPI002AFF9E7C|nr:alcohol dehydrogenase catalytic domain-containing protein [Sphingomonas sp. SGZ-02]